MVSSALRVTKCGGGARSVARLANVRASDRWSSEQQQFPGGSEGPVLQQQGGGDAVAESARCKAVADPVSPLRYTNFVMLLYAA
jgi:hypothetical protein